MGPVDRNISYVTGGSLVDNILRGIDCGAYLGDTSLEAATGVFLTRNYKDSLTVSHVVCEEQQEFIVQPKRTTDSLVRIHDTRSREVL